MIQRLLGTLCVALLFAGGPARADDEADMKALIAKAIKAHGGAEVLDKFKGVTMKLKGKVYPPGFAEGLDFTGDLAIQSPDRVRIEVAGEFMGQNFRTIQIVDRDKGWFTLNDNTMTMTKEMLKEAQEQFHSGEVARLIALTRKGFKLSPLGEAKVGERAVIGVRVEHEGRRDVSLFIDKENYLLLKMETRVKDVQGGDNEFTQETYYNDYKKIDGLQVAHKLTVKRDSKPHLETEASEAKVSEKLDDTLFAKP
jgi:outer membrane lipoprotein-sorting protein